MAIARMLVSAALLLSGSALTYAQQLSPQDQALFDAIQNHNVQQVENALEQGAQVEARLPEGNQQFTFATPLIAAACYGFPQAVQILLQHHANIEAKDKSGDTALTAAVGYHAGADVLKILLGARANLEASSPEYFGCHPDHAADDYEGTALINAACLGYADTVKLLLERGANAEAKDNHGHSALNVAASAGKIDVVRLLLARYAPGAAIPETARRPFVQANTLYKTAQSNDDVKAALALYEQALDLAPWYADAWYNQSLAQEKLGNYKGALASMNAFQQLEPGGLTDRATLDRIYALEARAK